MPPEPSLRDRLLGAWRLVDWEAIAEDLTVESPVGDAFEGQLLYDSANGRVSVHLAAARPEPFASDDWRRATDDEMVLAWPYYLGYLGHFEVDEHQWAVTHHIEASSFPNLVGVADRKSVSFESGSLVLASDTVRGMSRLTWARYA